ncbi:hypothetical protein PAHAL_4G136900 [Panicum hallii]|jgi:hypothetical protein|uniref:Uncharacterized protein n=1 Tax=Panicum hallii TaxID=206008 RepID=A0A2T8JCU2_9POAL|nr:hypothetical protein PAHAL_4G136900 [Panicum hallii]
MASFSSVSSNSPSSSSIISITSPDSNTSREVMPEFDPIASYEAHAPLHWDAGEWDYSTWSEDDEPLTDDEDLQILLYGVLDEGDDEDSWDDNFFSFSEEDAKDISIGDDSAAGGFLHGGSSTSEDDGDASDNTSDDGGDSNNNTNGDDGSSDDDASASPLYKHRKTLGTYWW